MHFKSREDFDKYMKDFEREYFDALQVKNTPYEFSGTGIKPSLASHLMPQYPSQPVLVQQKNNDFDLNYIDRARLLHARRRGIDL